MGRSALLSRERSAGQAGQLLQARPRGEAGRLPWPGSPEREACRLGVQDPTEGVWGLKEQSVFRSRRNSIQEGTARGWRRGSLLCPKDHIRDGFIHFHSQDIISGGQSRGLMRRDSAPSTQTREPCPTEEGPLLASGLSRREGPCPSIHNTLTVPPGARKPLFNVLNLVQKVSAFWVSVPPRNLTPLTCLLQKKKKEKKSCSR